VTGAGIEIRPGEDGVVRVALSGELDLAAAPEVERKLREHERDGAVLLLDLRGVKFMDSTGLRVILSADSRARRDDRKLVLVRGPEAVHRVFRLTLLDQRLEFVQDEATSSERGG